MVPWTNQSFRGSGKKRLELFDDTTGSRLVPKEFQRDDHSPRGYKTNSVE